MDKNNNKTEQPILETSRLVLRPFLPSDAPQVQRLAGDVRVASMTKRIPHPYPDGMAKAWIATHPQEWQAQRSIVYAITFKDASSTTNTNAELIGSVGLELLSSKEDNTNTERTAELGYWIGTPYWGNGLCTEAAQELIRNAFITGSLFLGDPKPVVIEKIQALHFACNFASGRVMAKAGMRHVKRVQESYRGE